MRKLVLLSAVAVISCAGCFSFKTGDLPDVNVDVGNGRREPLPPPRAPRDDHEPNNDRERPSGLRLGKAQMHSISPAGDEDWLICPIARPGVYAVRIDRAELPLDVELWLRSREDPDDEDEVESLTVRGSRTFTVNVRPYMRYIKLKIEADRRNDTGRYQVFIVRR